MIRLNVLLYSMVLIRIRLDSMGEKKADKNHAVNAKSQHTHRIPLTSGPSGGRRMSSEMHF